MGRALFAWGPAWDLALLFPRDDEDIVSAMTGAESGGGGDDDDDRDFCRSRA